MKKVLVINEFFSDNLGDVAIGITMKKYIESLGLSVDIVDYTKSNKREIPEILFNETPIKFITKIKGEIAKIIPFYRTLVWFKNNKQIYKSINVDEYNTVIIGGGQLLLSNGYFIVSLFLWYRIFFENLSSIELNLYGVGIGNNISFIDKVILKKILPNFKNIYVRDYNSLNKLQDLLGNSAEIKYAPDIVYYYNKDESFYKEKIIAVSMMDYKTINDISKKYNSEEEFMDVWIELINKNNKVNYKIILIYTTIQDKRQAYRFLEYSKLKGYNYEIINTDSLEIYTEQLKKANLVISARMHALILAQNFNCEVIPFVFSDKLKSFKDENIKGFNINSYRELIDKSFKSIIRI